MRGEPEMPSVGQYRKQNYSNRQDTWKSMALPLCLICIPLLYGCGPWHLPPYGYIDKDDPPLASTPVQMPQNAPSIPQGFKPVIKRDLGFEVAGHEGIDIKADKYTPVIAAAPGTVIASKWEPLFGHQIYILHDTKDEHFFVQSQYFHLSKRLLQAGDEVKRGQQIGTLGSTGLLASYPHLHFEVRVSEIKDRTNYSPVNPHRYWSNGAGKISCYESGKNYSTVRFSTSYPVFCR